MTNEKTKPAKKQGINWAAVLWNIHLHVLGIYAIWLLFTSAKWMTLVFTLALSILGCIGITIGAHRLWAHGSFKASGTVRLFLMLAHTIAGVGPIYDWVLYHRLHHKYYGTDKDAYNHSRGFWYSHYVANLVSPNVDYEQAKLLIDMRDMEADRYVWIQKKLYWLIFAIFGLLLPLNAPLEYWDEAMATTVFTTGILRFAITANTAWMVNSALIIWGLKGNKAPSDFSIFVVRRSFWPAYHYKLPWDWKNGEFGTYGTGCNVFLIKMWYELGLVDELKTVSTEDIREILHSIANEKMTMDDGLTILKERSDYNARMQKMLPHH